MLSNMYVVVMYVPEEQPCEIILNLDQWFRRKCCLKVFLIQIVLGKI